MYTEQTMQNEIWKKIDGFENYSVSDHGNVRDDKRGRMKKQSKLESGYNITGLTKNNLQKMFYIHKLVGEAFLPNPDNKSTIDHIDNDKLNNKVANLRWASMVEQAQNRGIRSDNQSGSKGVSWHKNTQKWQAQIRVNGKCIHLGYFMNKDDAITIRIQRAKDEFGEFTNKCELILNV